MSGAIPQRITIEAMEAYAKRLGLIDGHLDFVFFVTAIMALDDIDTADTMKKQSEASERASNKQPQHTRH